MDPHWTPGQEVMKERQIKTSKACFNRPNIE